MITKQNWGGTATPDDIYPGPPRPCCGWACDCSWYDPNGGGGHSGTDEWHGGYAYNSTHLPNDSVVGPY